MTPAAHHTDTAPHTPSCLHPRSVQTRPTPGTRPRATRATMPRCPDQRHIWGRPSTQIVHRIRWHRSITPRTRAPGPKLLTTRANRGEIASMSTRTGGGPSGVSGLLDHETQIRPRAQKNRGIGGGTANFHDCNGAARTKAHTLLLRTLSGAILSFDPYNRAVACHLCCLLAC